MLEYVVKDWTQRGFLLHLPEGGGKKKSKTRTYSDLIQLKYSELNNFNEYSSMEKKIIKNFHMLYNKITLFLKVFIPQKQYFNVKM